MTGVLPDFMAEFQRNAGLSSQKQHANAPSDALKPPSTRNESPSNSSARLLSMRDEIPNISVSRHTNPDESVFDDVTLQLSSRKLEKPSFQGRNMKSCSSFLSESLKMSFVAHDLSDDIACNKSDEHLPLSDELHKMSMLGSNNLQVSSAGFLEGNRSMVGPGPSLDLTTDMPPPSLDLTNFNSTSNKVRYILTILH